MANTFQTAAAFIIRAQADEHVLEFPFGTYTRDTDKHEHGRWAPINCFNAMNRTTIAGFLTRVREAGHELNLQSDGHSLTKQMKTVMEAMFDASVLEQHLATHRAPFRYYEGLAATILYCTHTVPEIMKFHGTSDIINMNYANIIDDGTGQFPYTVADPCEFTGTVEVTVDTRKTQDVAREHERTLKMVAASAGATDRLEEGGGTFGDPCYSCTTQEEDIFRTLPAVVKYCFYFEMSDYVHEMVGEEMVSRFMYKPEFAPRDGRAIVASGYYFSAAHNNKKFPIPEDELKKKHLVCLATFLESARQLNAVAIGCAWGCGVFANPIEALANAIATMRRDHGGPDGVKYILAYFCPNPAAVEMREKLINYLNPQ